MIGPDDGVTIVALGAEDISKTWRVSSTGELTLPMVGKIQAAGKTTEQLELELTARLKRFIREPEVTVYISEFRSETVTVEGAVQKPGRVQTEGQKTLLDVLMMAGGTSSPGPTVKVTRASAYEIIPLPGVPEGSGRDVQQRRAAGEGCLGREQHRRESYYATGRCRRGVHTTATCVHTGRSKPGGCHRVGNPRLNLNCAGLGGSRRNDENRRAGENCDPSKGF